MNNKRKTKTKTKIRRIVYSKNPNGNAKAGEKEENRMLKGTCENFFNLVSLNGAKIVDFKNVTRIEFGIIVFVPKS